MIKYIIYGAKWWDGVNGNTYHNTKIINARNQKTYYTGYAYGYGSQYRQSAEDFIKNKLKAKNYFIIDVGSSYGFKKSELKNNCF